MFHGRFSREELYTLVKSTKEIADCMTSVGIRGRPKGSTAARKAQICAELAALVPIYIDMVRADFDMFADETYYSADEVAGMTFPASRFPGMPKLPLACEEGTNPMVYALLQVAAYKIGLDDDCLAGWYSALSKSLLESLSKGNRSELETTAVASIQSAAVAADLTFSKRTPVEHEIKMAAIAQRNDCWERQLKEHPPTVLYEVAFKKVLQWIAVYKHPSWVLGEFSDSLEGEEPSEENMLELIEIAECVLGVPSVAPDPPGISQIANHVTWTHNMFHEVFSEFPSNLAARKLGVSVRCGR